MILETKTDTLILEDGESQETKNMTIDSDSHIFLMRMLSKFYSDPIGSLIRETASNALDSHRACDSQEPIIVSLRTDNKGNYEFTVQDFGCGIGLEEMDNVISKYGKSTKRNSNNQLGAFGLGLKSPLSYTSAFYIIGVKDGIKRKWMMYESDNENNKIDLLFESPTEEKNGATFVVPVKYSDKSDFINKISEQLAYFESVYFVVNGIVNDNIKIIRNEHFQWSSLNHDEYLHICLDNVYYPIDFQKLGIRPVRFPVGLRFGLADGIFPTPNRESIKYTEEAKNIILNKLSLVADYFIKRYNDQIKNKKNVIDILNHYSNVQRSIPHINGEIFDTMNVRELEKYSDIVFQDPTLDEIKLLDWKDIIPWKDQLLSEYNIIYELKTGRFQTIKKSYKKRIVFRKLQATIICKFTEIGGIKKAYLRELYGTKTVLFVRKENKMRLGSIKEKYYGRGEKDTYMTILQLWNYPKSEWRERIKELQHIISLLTNNFIDVDKLDVPQIWLDERKKKRLQSIAEGRVNKKLKRIEGEIVVKVAEDLRRYVRNKNCKFVPTNIEMKNQHAHPGLTIYGTEDWEDKFQKLFSAFNKNKVRFILLSTREIKKLKDLNLHNWIEINKFMEGKHIVFRRAVTAFLINSLIEENRGVFDRLNYIKRISTPLYKDLHSLKLYASQYSLNAEHGLYLELVEIAKANNLFDPTIYDVYQNAKKTLEKLTFLNPLLSAIGGYSWEEIKEPVVPVLRDLFKYYKHKMDWQNYDLPINENIEEAKEEELEEQLI